MTKTVKLVCAGKCPPQIIRLDEVVIEYQAFNDSHPTPHEFAKRDVVVAVTSHSFTRTQHGYAWYRCDGCGAERIFGAELVRPYSN